jgi:hypothetical protein
VAESARSVGRWNPNGTREGHAAGWGNYPLNAKDNFIFERTLRYRQAR